MRRNVVSYSDGWSDDTWAMVLEGEEDIWDVIEQGREKAVRWSTNKSMQDDWA